MVLLAFLGRYDVNYIAVDWQELANDIDYVVPALNTQQVGQVTGEFVQFLLDNGANLNDFHIIGFSLGAHVAGKAGAVLGGRTPRVTGTIERERDFYY